MIEEKRKKGRPRSCWIDQIKAMTGHYLPGGVLEFGFGGGVRLTTQNPYPFLGVILAENRACF